MNDLRTAAQQALDYWEQVAWGDAVMVDKMDALRAALAQQAEPVKPAAKVELMMTGGNAGLATRIVEIDDHLRERLRPGQLLYTAPPQRQPLTDGQILAMYNNPETHADMIEFARAIEKAHGIGGSDE